jgi:hypothetical protein
MTQLSAFPIKETIYILALLLAKQASQYYPDFFFYILKNNSGGYFIDHIGLPHSDEHVIATFKNGEKVL